ADLVDMEFVQFFPIGHLAPRLVGMDPIMWDPFRYKLGGRLLDGSGREFLADYGSDETSGYTTPRDLATYAIHKEIAAGRGSPHGGVYLSFTHVPKSALEAAFGPVITRLAKNGIDLGRMPVEVAPFRPAAGLARAVARLAEMRAGLSEAAIVAGCAFNPTLADWFELRASLVAAEAVAHAALAREESRGAHQREDFPETDPAWARPQYVRMTRDGTLAVSSAR